MTFIRWLSDDKLSMRQQYAKKKTALRNTELGSQEHDQYQNRDEIARTWPISKEEVGRQVCHKCGTREGKGLRHYGKVIS